MNLDDRKRLIANHKYLVEHLVVVEVTDYLLEKGVISFEEKEEAEIERISSKANRVFLRILHKKGPTSFRLFRSALKESESISFIADKLDSTDISNVQIADSGLDQDEKMAQLQQQMFMQTELLMKYKQDKDNLEQRLKQNEQKTEELQTKYGDFEKTIQERGLSNSQAIGYLKEYLNNKDVPDFSFQLAPSPSPSPSKTDSSLSPSKSFTFSRADIESSSSSLCEAIARDVGKDIVRYMVQSTMKAQRVKQPSNKYAAVMRKLIDKVLAQHEELFTKFIVKLHKKQINGWDTFVAVADEIFVGENNWGRLVVLYAFAGFVARHAAENGSEKMAMFMGDFLGFYVVKKLGPWIEDNDGWDGFYDRFKDGADSENDGWLKYVYAGLAVAGVGALVGIVAAKS